MSPFHDHHNLLDRSSSEQLELNPHPLSPGEFRIPLSPPSFYIPEEGLHDLLFNLPSPLPPLPPPSAPADGTTISAASGAMRKNAASNEGFGRRGAAGKDRHTKIHTATGPRDRRMRLSLEVARKFFNLQDMLRFDKASQTVQWLLNKSRIAIRELACSISSQNLCSFSHQSSESYASECEDVASTISDSKGKSAMSQKYAAPSEAKKPKAERAANRSTRKPLLSNPMLAKAWRAKARERARERTREKKRIMCCSSTSLDAVEDESGPMHNLYLTPQSLEERCLISNSHNYQDCMRSAANCDLQMDGNGGSDLTPILAYDYYNGSTTNILQEQQCDMGTVLLADHACTLYPLN